MIGKLSLRIETDRGESFEDLNQKIEDKTQIIEDLTQKVEDLTQKVEDFACLTHLSECWPETLTPYTNPDLETRTNF